MLTYLEVHLYFVVPPIIVLLALYWPLLGRRDVIKIAWLIFMATAYTTPWDNFILAQSGWGYPPGAVVAKIFHVPIEEHLFFILQPILLVLLHAILTHPRLLPFSTSRLLIASTTPAPSIRRHTRADGDGDVDGKAPLEDSQKRTLQMLPRRPLASLFWAASCLLGAVLVSEAHQLFPHLTPEPLRIGTHAFYLGWILLWISPVIGWLTYLGGRVDGGAWRAWVVGSAYLWFVDTYAIRHGVWYISRETSLDWQVWRGLPFEEFLFFALTSYLLVIACSLTSHIHTLLLLSPSLPPCPPLNPFKHILLLIQVALHPPFIDAAVLEGLEQAAKTLRKGSKSFEVAKLAFGREMRIGLVAVYAWCRVTDNLIDEPIYTDREPTDAKLATLSAIRQHLHAAYAPIPSRGEMDRILDQIPHLSPADRSAFHLFAALIPRLVPVDPFLELCRGYETDMAFLSLPPSPSSALSPSPSAPATSLRARLSNPAFDLDTHLPIKTTDALLRYADDVAGSIASAICYLSWSILSSPLDPAKRTRPIDDLPPHHPSAGASRANDRRRLEVVASAREMGRALQLVNIARDVAKDALIARVYIPLSSFPSAHALLALLLPPPSPPQSMSYAPYTLPTLDLADRLNQNSYGAIAGLPRTARGGTRAMVASYFEIAKAIRRGHGEVDERGVRVSRWKRAGAAAKAMWVG